MIIKYSLSLLLLVSILAMGVFGFTFLNHEMNHANDDCLVNTINGEACPTKIVEFAMNNTLVSSIFNLFFALIFLLLLPFSILLLSQGWRDLKLKTNYCRRSFIRWLALLEHSPSF